MTRRKLPIGIQTFREIREEGCYYVDKTPYAIKLIEQGKHYFLSRPRRFGKSLFLDTLAELFSGNRALFEGLYAEAHWDWSVRYPVIRISFAEGRLESREQLDQRIWDVLRQNQEALGVTCPPGLDIPGCFGELIRRAERQYGQRAVVLIDEYDKPILDNLGDKAVAAAMREGLRNLYSVLKGQDAHLRFVFLTGVSKFSKVSIFSGLNNLEDITLDARYSAICGYTDADIDTVFAPELEGLDREEIRRWYNGYGWLGERVYNPFDVLLLFSKRSYRAWWFETGTPTFLVELLTKRHTFTPKLDALVADDQLLGAFDVEHIATEAILWQTGYLTIVAEERLGRLSRYRLGYPNLEVESALNNALLTCLLPEAQQAVELSLPLYRLLVALDFDGLKAHFESLYASIPADWYRNNPITQYEGYWASVFYSHIASLGLDLTPEDVTNQGRIDLTLKLDGAIVVIEFKRIAGEEPTGEAIAQLKARGYADKYRADGRPVYLLGVEFSAERRNVVGWDWVAVG
ncbi:ATP-binding protein [Tepidimonas taiwanensis]|uniref:Putative AAA-ATPase n=1 Tax=Tepidimonas taiwanensis TaxID=307486 RepID=A0A554X4P3_9BURK|nr:ATP-binding protein [Tepidimonas taiwanensis]MDM7463397.1 ATP-binding protein [Tepidimonas taiwanensis]TSE30809.1 putative AAA-ATPase [Tepidimonas taiwanensis]UBQ05085.1 ATP-binding protein [Tepidimonas taiwanensis]